MFPSPRIFFYILPHGSVVVGIETKKCIFKHGCVKIYLIYGGVI